MIENTCKRLTQELAIMNVQDLKLLGIGNATVIILVQINIEIKMTLDEAIQHCEEKIDNTTCGLEHRQLRDWLIELKERRNS